MTRRRRHLGRWITLIFGTPVGAILLIGAITGGTASCLAAAGTNPSPAANKSIPANLLAIYQQVGSQYGIPWEILAGIGQEECEQGRLASAACKLQPGATGPGATNSAGASGLMQIGVGGASGDAYDQLRHYLPNPALGPHDPTTAVQLAALVLIKDKGAPTGQPIESYLAAVTAYNGTGTAAQAYAQRVIADAITYQGTGGNTASVACESTGSVNIIPGSVAKILPDGVAEAPANAPPVVQQMIAAGNRIIDFPYSWGGGHGDPAQTMNRTAPDPAAVPGNQENGGPGYDCSSATSYVLWGGGYGQSLLDGGVWDSTDLEHVGLPGAGRWVTIYAQGGHAYIEVAGIYLDTAAGQGKPPNPPSTGPRWTPVGTGPGGFVARHPPGL